MWVLLLIMSTGTVDNLEFNNVESCQHAHNFFEQNIAGIVTDCIYVTDKSVIEPKEPGQSNEL